MAIYKFNTEFGEMALLNPVVKIHGRVGINFNEAENITSFVMPVMLDTPGPSQVPWEFESSVMPNTWEPPDIEAWGLDRLTEHKL